MYYCISSLQVDPNIPVLYIDNQETDTQRGHMACTRSQMPSMHVCVCVIACQCGFCWKTRPHMKEPITCKQGAVIEILSSPSWNSLRPGFWTSLPCWSITQRFCEIVITKIRLKVNICICTAESFCCKPETNTTL